MIRRAQCARRVEKPLVRGRLFHAHFQETVKFGDVLDGTTIAGIVHTQLIVRECKVVFDEVVLRNWTHDLASRVVYMVHQYGEIMLIQRLKVVLLQFDNEVVLTVDCCDLPLELDVLDEFEIAAGKHGLVGQVVWVKEVVITYGKSILGDAVNSNTFLYQNHG